MGLTTVHDLEAVRRARRASRALARPDIAIADLCCASLLLDEVDDAGWELFEQLRGLPQLNVAAWCARNGTDRFRLARAVMQSIGASPSTLVRCYLATTVAVLHGRGLPYTLLAPVFGYSDASSLHRALRRHARGCPGTRPTES
jgi:AraC-like DNA-binding protein